MAKIAYATKVDVITTGTAAINKVRADDMNEIKTSVNALYDQDDVIANYTGWGDYVDTQYTEASPFSVSADTITNLPNNKGTVIETQKPSDITTFYDGTVVTGRDGDAILVTIDFLCKPTSANTTFVEIWVDITGGTGIPSPFANLYKRIVSFPKGNGVERPINFTFSAYTLNTWEANGGVVKLLGNGTFEVYDIRYVITRTHKAR